MAEFLALAPTSQWTAIHPIVSRLVVAAALGGVIGLEREISRKPAGLRTQLFICMGAAFFTILSNDLAGTLGGDHTRIAAQIIPGIGFIGAGSILHSRGSVTGLTTAATLFVVASIGMAAGGGLYGPAVFATLLALLSLKILGWLETRFSLKPLVLFYEAVGRDMEELLNTVNSVLADEHQVMQRVQVSRVDHSARVQFTIDASRKEHQAVLQRLRQSPVLERVQCSETSEAE
jgi:putative Mg2+ transporter-C (MgtC) family protein